MIPADASRCCLRCFCRGRGFFLRAANVNRLNKLGDVVGVELDSPTAASGRGMLSEASGFLGSRLPPAWWKRSTLGQGGTGPNRKASPNNSFGRRSRFVRCVLWFNKSGALLLCKLWCELMKLPRRAVWLPVAAELLHKHGSPVLHDDDVDIRMKTEIQSVWLADEWEARLQN